MPDYDYEQFDRKHEEWEAQQLEESQNEGVAEAKTPELREENTEETDTTSVEDDMDW